MGRQMCGFPRVGRVPTTADQASLGYLYAIVPADVCTNANRKHCTCQYNTSNQGHASSRNIVSSAFLRLHRHGERPGQSDEGFMLIEDIESGQSTTPQKRFCRSVPPSPWGFTPLKSMASSQAAGCAPAKALAICRSLCKVQSASVLRKQDNSSRHTGARRVIGSTAVNKRSFRV